MRLYSVGDLKRICPVKWHENIPDDGISLGVADVDFEGPLGIIDYIKQNLRDSFSFYQYKRGLPSSLDVVQNFLRGQGVEATHNNLQIIPGTMMGIYAAQKWASRREGKVVYVGPLYEPIHRHGKDTGNKIDFSHIYKTGLDVEMLKEKVDSSTKMISINNPSNPIGYVYTRDELLLIRDLAVDLDIPVFSDELYEPLIFDRANKKHIALASIDGMAERTIALYGFSKAYGLAGYRSGFMYCGDLVTEELQFIVQAQLVSPSPFESLVCDWALTAENSQKWVEEFRHMMEETTEFATNKFNEHGFECDLPESCFFVYPDIGVDDVKFAEQILPSKGVQVVPGSYFGPTGKSHLRINCATNIERLDEGITRVIAELNGK